ncbi:hypothetical protein GIB67_022725 [Kingdonia uniflora]|uniref:Uncharacterized protein n=1 Tax=Kingdonia uniflora TaxID=39325 RepID=A0A7J7P8R7_9MAGN|nr:hypothetical protein GIB67_022725 [Kingdonia uniflora]
MEQSILFVRLSRFCTDCVLQGHNKASCTKLHPILVPDKREVIKHGKVTIMGSSGQSYNIISLPQTIKILEPVETKTKRYTVGLKTAMLMGQIAALTEVTVSRTMGQLSTATLG